MTDLDYFAPVKVGGPPRKPPHTRPVKTGGPPECPADVAVDNAIVAAVGKLETELRADIDAMVADMVKRKLVALETVWGKGQVYVVGTNALWGVS